MYKSALIVPSQIILQTKKYILQNQLLQGFFNGERVESIFIIVGDSLDYLWHADNLETAEGSPEAEQINIKSTFRDLWNPVMVLEKYHNKKR